VLGREPEGQQHAEVRTEGGWGGGGSKVGEGGKEAVGSRHTS